MHRLTIHEHPLDSFLEILTVTNTEHTLLVFRTHEEDCSFTSKMYSETTLIWNIRKYPIVFNNSTCKNDTSGQFDSIDIHRNDFRCDCFVHSYRIFIIFYIRKAEAVSHGEDHGVFCNFILWRGFNAQEISKIVIWRNCKSKESTRKLVQARSPQGNLYTQGVRKEACTSKETTVKLVQVKRQQWNLYKQGNHNETCTS